MPLTPRNDLPANPLVRIFFSGQLIIEPASDGTCEVFVNQSATGHQLSIEIRMKRPGLPDVILMRQLGLLVFATPRPPSSDPIHGFLIQAASPAGVKGYNGTTASTEGTGISTAIDLRNLHPTVGNVQVDAPSGRPSIFLDDGVFYVAEQTPSNLTINLKRGGTVVRQMTPFGSLIGANIYGEAQVVWRLNGKPKSLPLTRLAVGLSYEIYISNDPLFEEATLSPHDELAEYYKILPGVPTSDRFSMDFPPAPPGQLTAKRDDRGSIRTPCMCVFNGI
jgi:hypothetical protein